MGPHGVLLSLLQAVARQEAAGKAVPTKCTKSVCRCGRVCSLEEAKSLLRFGETLKAAPAGKAAPAPAPEVPEK